MSLSFYRHIDNWHKHPIISKLLCKIGRHDYEYEKPDEYYATVILRCFYCGQIKSSCNSNLREAKRKEIGDAIAEAEANDKYDIAEHLTNQIDLEYKKDRAWEREE